MTLLSVRLSVFFDVGCDLAGVLGLLGYVLVFVIVRRTMTVGERDALVGFFLANYAIWVAGGSVNVDGVVVALSLDWMRHALWLAEGLDDEAVVRRFEDALLAAVRDGLL